MANETPPLTGTVTPDKQKNNRVPETAWKPGQSGNPNGRPPKGHSITDTIKEMMGEKPEIKKALGTKLIELALKGDMAAIKLLMGYMDGMPVQPTELTGRNGGPLELTAVPYEQLLAEAKALGISTTPYDSLNTGSGDNGAPTENSRKKRA